MEEEHATKQARKCIDEKMKMMIEVLYTAEKTNVSG